MNNETVKEAPKKKKMRFGFFKIFLAIVVLAAAFYFGFTCEVREGSCAVILRFGAVREEITDAGLYFKLPWPFETVTTYDSRVQYLESNYLGTTTKDKRNIIVQSYAVWHIDNPVVYHNTVGVGGTADSYIKDQIFDATNGTLGSFNLTELLSLDSEEIKIDEIQEQIFARVRDHCAASYGIIVDDISIMRLSLPDTNLESVFEQMRAECNKEISTILNTAQTEADGITSKAEADAEAIIKEGSITASEKRAQTEAEVAAIYAAAQAENLELYKFLKELDTVTASVGESTVLVVKTDEYPFNILTKYTEQDSDEAIIKDLSTVMEKLDDAERQALVDAIYALIEQSGGTQ